MARKLTALILVVGLMMCMGMTASAEEVHVKVGVVGENNYQWEEIIIPTLAEEGIIIELVKFGDYVVPNQALQDGEIDMNAFQHHAYMNDWNEKNNGTLVALCDTLIAPLCIYSKKITSLDELKEGDGVAIMSDAVNQYRALLLLQDSGLITLDEAAGTSASVQDIVENKLNLQFTEIEAALTPVSMDDPDIAIAFLNGTHAKDAGLSMDQALAIESTPNYVNNIAIRAEDVGNPTYERIAEAYHTDEVKALFETVYKDVYLAAW